MSGGIVLDAGDKGPYDSVCFRKLFKHLVLGKGLLTDMT